MIPSARQTMTVDEFIESYDWRASLDDAMEIGCGAYSDSGHLKGKVVRVVAVAPGENDGLAWIAVLELAPNAFEVNSHHGIRKSERFAVIRASADYTGHG